jgi:hypothetical protein
MTMRKAIEVVVTLAAQGAINEYRSLCPKP